MGIHCLFNPTVSVQELRKISEVSQDNADNLTILYSELIQEFD